MDDILVLLVVVGGIAAGGAWTAFVSHQYLKHRLRSFPDVNAFRRKKAVLRAIIGICIILIVTTVWSASISPSRDGHGGDHDYCGHDTAYSAPRRK